MLEEIILLAEEESRFKKKGSLPSETLVYAFSQYLELYLKAKNPPFGFTKKFADYLSSELQRKFEGYDPKKMADLPEKIEEFYQECKRIFEEKGEPSEKTYLQFLEAAEKDFEHTINDFGL